MQTSPKVKLRGVNLKIISFLVLESLALKFLAGPADLRPLRGGLRQRPLPSTKRLDKAPKTAFKGESSQLC